MNTTSDFDTTSSRQGSEQPTTSLTRPHPTLRPNPSASAYFYSPATAPIHGVTNTDNSQSPQSYAFPSSSYTHGSISRAERPAETRGTSQRESTAVVDLYHARGRQHTQTQSRGFSNQQHHSQPYQPRPHQEPVYQDQLQHNRLYNDDPSSHRRQTEDDDDENDNDDDDDDDQDFVGTVDETADSQEQLHQLPLRSLARPSRPLSSYELHSNNFISHDEFRMLADDYLMSLSPKKREKALLSNSMYQKILMVLLQPKNTQVSTAQFRFWAKKMFTMSTTETHHVVCHAGKPVATKECLYDVLVYCHRKSSHGGRDKTSAEVRLHYSWVPKELIARFVKHCPLCSSRRFSLQRPLSMTALSSIGIGASSSSVEFSSQMDLSRFQDRDAAFHGRQAYLGNYLGIRDPERVDPSSSGPQHVYQSHQQQAQQHLHSQQSQNQLYWSAPQTSLQQHYGARLHSEHMYHLQQQRAQQNLIGRSCPNFQYEQHAQQGGPSTQFITVGAQQLPSDSHYYGTPALEPYRAHRSGEAGGGHDSLLTDDNEVLAGDEGRWYDQQNDLLWSNEGVRSAVQQDHEMDDDCTPSGLVGIPQEIRRLDRWNVSRVPDVQQQFPSQHPQQESGFQLRSAHYLHEPLHQGQPSEQGPLDPTEGEIQEMGGRVYHDRLSSQGSVLLALGHTVPPSAYAYSSDPYADHNHTPHASALQGSRQPNDYRLRQAPSAFIGGDVLVASRRHATRDGGTREIRGQGDPSRQSEQEHDELESSRDMT